MTFVPAFPVGTTYVPGDAVILRVFEQRYLTLINDVVASDRQFVSALISSGSEVGGEDQRFSSGVLVEIDHVEPTDFGLMIHGHATHTIDIAEWNDEASYPRARIIAQEQEMCDPSLVSDLVADLGLLAKDIDTLIQFMEQHNIAHPAPPGGAFFFADMDVHSADMAALWASFWSLVRLLPSSPLARQELLRPAPLGKRLARAREEVVHLREIITFRFGQ